MVDLGGYVIIITETEDGKIKLYGSHTRTPPDRNNPEVGDEILEVNGRTLEDASHAEVIKYIHQVILSRTIVLRVKRKNSEKIAALEHSNAVQDAFVIAVEEQARERLQRLSVLKTVTPIDMTVLQRQLLEQTARKEERNGFINRTPLYVQALREKEAALREKDSANNNNNNVTVSNPPSIGWALSNRPSTSKEPEPTDIVSNQTDAVQLASTTVQEQLAGPSWAITNDVRAAITPSDQLEVRRSTDRRASSPFQNGGTELLIGKEDNKLKTTAVVESNNNLLVDRENRPRRRSGSSIVVLDGEFEPVKKPPDEIDDGLGYNMVMMLAGDNGPHREMAVDVPDTFIARNKTPPRYPPPKPNYQTPSVNGNATTPAPVASAAGVKPVPPPRDHIKVDKDGWIGNRTPAPQLPARLNNNNNVTTSGVTSVSAAATPPAAVEPTREQLDSIKKYQEQLRKRKEEDERIAAQNEFLNHSLRGSRKLQALESRPQGAINDAYADDDHYESSRSTTPAEKEIVHAQYGYGDLVASIQRLQLQLKKAQTGNASGLASLEGRVAAVQSLLLSPQFRRALAVHNKVQSVRLRTAPRPSATAQIALRDCLDALGASQSAYAVELATLLTGYELEALMLAHDGVASVLPPSEPSDVETVKVADVEATVQSLPGHYGEENIKIIKIEKSTEPLGATVRNDGEAVVIGRIVRGGAADKSGLLHEGDEILDVNGIEMRGKSVNTVCDILQAMEGTITFLIVPAGQTRSHSARDNVLHVRAHFDYDPEEDMYIPCRELGMSFQKGDVLHIISQEDPNWWQAYREGEEDQTLAGLVPSQSFQHQRESVRLTAEERMSKPQKKSSTLLCGTSQKSKKKKGLSGDSGYPIYASPVDEFEQEEILTYEEVALYYPRSNRKRPIVLIGPSTIGRQELRQRLMEDSERFAAAVPHTSRARQDNEVDGQDYHFITRAQFEADILSRKFVEHGEYEKAYYGTSLDAIRSVVNTGRICILNLHPQSLKLLRASDLKPYVVFVAPPNLEKLRQKKIRNGEAFKEEDLKDIIEKAREMEDKYGHLFDMTIVNNDIERSYQLLLGAINSLEREPQWVPAAWVKGP